MSIATPASKIKTHDPLWDVPEASLPLGARLVRAGLLSQDDLERALERQEKDNTRLGEILTRMGLVEEEEILPFLNQQLGVPSVRLREGIVDPKVVQMIPRSHAETLKAVALFKVRKEIFVAMAEPQNLRQVDEVERLTGLTVRPVIALKSSIERLIPRCYEKDFQVDHVTADIDESAIELQADTMLLDLQSSEAMADGSPIINLVNYFIVNSIRQGASDIHIEPGQKHTTIRFRVDGMLREVLRPRRDFHAALVSRVKVMARMDIAEHRQAQDGRMHVVVDNREVDIRVSTLPTVKGEKVVMRVLDRKNLTFNLNELGIPSEQLNPIKKMLQKPHGLLLVTGPTGSGKTTTLYSALELIKSVHTNIVTVEDPVEYQLDMINQVHANPSANLSFSDALRSILRQDPDVIMVGEIRDAETAEMAIQASLTGHLVLSTLHTNSTIGAITRLMDMGIMPYKISAALVGVVAQRLIRTVCPRCRTKYYPNEEMLQMIEYSGDTRRSFSKGEGCAQCYDTGFAGRTGIYEVLPIDREFRQAITHSDDMSAVRDLFDKKGINSLLDEGIKLAESGSTSLDEVVRLAFAD
ncbi:Type II secretion system protein E [Polystyrenella longa]|uniref:Type II secretion system protein E n=1 Tax=Polystyrenella longa TaxID=2528007 RepID=A0A518CRN4_9PLAN|nr:GspE/PulE family protein [Polystyrenella longa]QDU81891.1 Type II secretion system protein E [Polystyrenella longa]